MGGSQSTGESTASSEEPEPTAESTAAPGGGGEDSGSGSGAVKNQIAAAGLVGVAGLAAFLFL